MAARRAPDIFCNKLLTFVDIRLNLARNRFRRGESGSKHEAGGTMTTRMITKICITLSTLAAVAAWTGPSQAQTGCNNSTIKGDYAALATAWNGPNIPPYTATPPYTPFFGLREVYFDGAGNFTSSGYKTTGGTPAKFTLNGIYTVSADCTMLQTPPTGSGVTPTFFGVIAADSNKIYQIRIDAGIESIIFERVGSGGQNQNSQ
jgi:hypothetical protein